MIQGDKERKCYVPIMPDEHRIDLPLLDFHVRWYCVVFRNWSVSVQRRTSWAVGQHHGGREAGKAQLELEIGRTQATAAAEDLLTWQDGGSSEHEKRRITLQL